MSDIGSSLERARFTRCIEDLTAMLTNRKERKLGVRFGVVTATDAGPPPTVTVGGRSMRFIDTGAGTPTVGTPVVVFQDEPSAVALAALGGGCLIEYLGQESTTDFQLTAINGTADTAYGIDTSASQDLIDSIDLTNIPAGRTNLYTGASGRQIQDAIYNHTTGTVWHIERDLVADDIFFYENYSLVATHPMTDFGRSCLAAWTDSGVYVVFGGVAGDPNRRDDRAVLCSWAAGGTVTEIADAGTVLPAGAGSDPFSLHWTKGGTEGLFFYYAQSGTFVDEMWHVTLGGTFTEGIASGEFFGGTFNVETNGDMRYLNEDTETGAIVDGTTPFATSADDCAQSMFDQEAATWQVWTHQDRTDFAYSIVACRTASGIEFYRFTP